MPCLATEGAVDVASFCSWWIGEDMLDALDQHLHAATNGAIDVVFREPALVQFKLHTTLSVSVVEAAKQTFYIQEYAVSQTSLEGTFNVFVFASKQERHEEPSLTRGCCGCLKGAPSTRNNQYRALSSP